MMHNYGGDHGKQIVITQEDKDQEVKKVRRLARICLAKMQGKPIPE